MKSDLFIQNRKAKFEYFFVREAVAGVSLMGSEVKAIKDGLVSFVDSFCYFNGMELFLKGLNVGIQKNSTAYKHEPLRERKLLLTKKELNKWRSELIDGLTIIPTRIFVGDNGYIKIGIALAKGKKTYDKKETLKNRDIEKQTKRELNR